MSESALGPGGGSTHKIDTLPATATEAMRETESERTLPRTNQGNGPLQRLARRSGLHLRMYYGWKLRRVGRKLLGLLGVNPRTLPAPDVYGIQWGDPDASPDLQRFKNRFVLPYVDPKQRAIEIGPGGGRWTRHLLGFSRLYAVDCHRALLNELRKSVSARNVLCVENDGTGFPGLADHSIDYVFSFGAFVHMHMDVIEAYLVETARVLKPGGNVVLQYADKTKPGGQRNTGYADNTPARMRALLSRCGYRVLEEDLTTFGDSAIVRCTRSASMSGSE